MVLELKLTREEEIVENSSESHFHIE